MRKKTKRRRVLCVCDLIEGVLYITVSERGTSRWRSCGVAKLSVSDCRKRGRGGEGLRLLFRGNGQAGGRGKGRSFVSSWGLLLAVAAGGHHTTATVRLCPVEQCGVPHFRWPSGLVVL